jgi:D,D-heptose 1,7-bisphosphate phosphatase
MPRPAVFLDRDGTLIEDREYLSDPAGVRLLPGVADGLRRLREAGFALVVVTNQSGIGRGWMTEADYRSVAAELDRQLAERGVSLDAAYFCPAAPAADPRDDHPDRKPAPGMLLRAGRDLDLDLSCSFVIGDAPRDLIAGERAGCRAGILMGAGKPPAPDGDWPIASDFAAAVSFVLRQLPGEPASATGGNGANERIS